MSETVKNDGKTESGPPNKQLFKPGNKFGKGRPKKENCWGDIARQMLQSKKIEITMEMPTGIKKISLKSDKSMKHGIIAAMIMQGLKGDVPAIRELMDRTDGKVPQAQVNLNANQNSNDLSKMPLADILKLAADFMGEDR